MAATERPLVPSDPAFIEELDPDQRNKKYEDEFEESSEVEPSPGDQEAPDEKPA